MSASALPSKLFFRIGEVASLVGVEPHVLRYWEREFRSIRPTKSAKGQRVYSRKDVENLLRVRDLLYRDGFTIAGAKKRLQRGPVAEATTDLLQQESDDEAHALATDGQQSDELELDGDTDAEAQDEQAEADELALASVAQPASGPRSHGGDEVRAKLTALRVEVEGFLHELDGSEHP
jgi:DNA-binding transcriptional MerR regulator